MFNKKDTALVQYNDPGQAQIGIVVYSLQNCCFFNTLIANRRDSSILVLLSIKSFVDCYGPLRALRA